MANKIAQRGRTSKALKQITKVVEADPAFPEAVTLQGMLKLAQADKDVEASHEARAAFSMALELDATLPHALLGLAHFQLLDGAADKATESARTALSQNDWGLFGAPEEEALTQAIAALDGEEAELGETIDTFLSLRKNTKMKSKASAQNTGEAVQ
jgi:tetratricopeptide (TPR) repeat protein